MCPEVLDFYDLKGVVEGLLAGLHVENVCYQTARHPSLHPGKAAQIGIDGKGVGVMGELHPLVKANYELGDAPVYVAEFDLMKLLESAGSCSMWNPFPATRRCSKTWRWWWMRPSRRQTLKR